MGIDSHYGDEDVKQEGKWFPLKGEDTELLIRHASNDDYVQYLMENLSQDARELLSAFSEDEGAIETDDSLDVSEGVAEEANDVLREGAAHHILVDWKNLTIDDPELAKKIHPRRAKNTYEEFVNGIDFEDLEKSFEKRLTDQQKEKIEEFKGEEPEHDLVVYLFEIGVNVPSVSIDYSSDNVDKLFDLIPDFYNEVKRIAQDQAAFKKNKRKHDKGN